jgi:O-antigen/teichoic acid export membrane protein
MGDLAQRAVRSTLAVAASNVAARAVSFAGTLYLMDRVKPESFGTVEYAAALLALCGSLSDWGFSAGAIHREERVDETFSTYLVLRLLMLTAVLGLVGVGALVLRGLVAATTRPDVLAALAGALVVDAACDVRAARLTRSLRFERLVAVDLASMVVATAAGVLMAAHGFGVWALVANRAGYSLCRAVGLWLVSVEPLRIAFHAEDALWLLRFGLPLWLGGLATTWVLKYDNLVVGRLRGKETLGQYGRAYALALLPLGLVSGVLTRVSFPLYARLQSDRARLSEAFRLASGTSLRLAAPMAVGMAIVMPDFLAVMHWSQWEAMVPMFRWLLVYAMARPLMDDAGGLLTAIGQPRVAVRMLMAEAAALLVLCPLLTWKWGGQGAAASVGLVVLGGLSVWYVRSLPRFVDIAYRRMLLWPLVSVAVAGAAGVLVSARAGLGVGLAGGAAKLAAVAATYLALMLLLDGRQTLADLRMLYRNATRKQP